MEDSAVRKEHEMHKTITVSRQALKALSGLEGFTGGPLSPLARMQAPEGPARAHELLAALDTLEDAWRWAVPALIDPHFSITLIIGDGNVNMVGQYAFPDAEAYGPGFEVAVENERLNLTGPLSLAELGIGFQSRLALEGVEEPPQFRMSLAADHFRALTACLDAYRSAALGRRLLRSGGTPAGVELMDIVEAWADGNSMLNPGWAVSLFSLLAPGDIPAELAKQLPGLLQDMLRNGYLKELKDTGSGLTSYAFADNLAPLLWDFTTALHFGLVVRRLAQPQAAEVSIMGGWRTPRGIWMADLSDMEDSGITLVLAGPGLASALIDDILGDDSLALSWEEFTMDTPYSRDAVISRLRRHQAGGETAPADAAVSGGESRPPSPSFCTRCGQPLQEGALFCKRCGTRVRRSHEVKSAAYHVVEQQPSCPNCGYIYPPGAKFCRGCGTRL